MVVFAVYNWATLYHFAGSVKWIGSGVFVAVYLAVTWVIMLVTIIINNVCTTNTNLRLKVLRGYTVTLAVFFYSISLLYLIYGPLLYRRLSALEINSEKVRSKMKKVFWFTMAIVIVCLTAGSIAVYEVAKIEDLIFNTRLTFWLIFGSNLTEICIGGVNLIVYASQTTSTDDEKFETASVRMGDLKDQM